MSYLFKFSYHKYFKQDIIGFYLLLYEYDNGLAKQYCNLLYLGFG